MTTHRLPLSSGQIETLIALNDIEATTARVVAKELRQTENGVSLTLRNLCRRGLTRRFHVKPPPAMTLADEIARASPRRRGKRPYHYALTVPGRKVARGLLMAARAIGTASPRRLPTDYCPQCYVEHVTAECPREDETEQAYWQRMKRLAEQRLLAVDAMDAP